MIDTLMSIASNVSYWIIKNDYMTRVILFLSYIKYNNVIHMNE